jgi:hypothetical protein
MHPGCTLPQQPCQNISADPRALCLLASEGQQAELVKRA